MSHGGAASSAGVPEWEGTSPAHLLPEHSAEDLESM